MKTIEEKAKAYDEGLKTVNAILNTMADSYVCTHLTKEDVREMYARIYSELRESEDERIYNEIMEFFKKNEKRCIVDNSYTRWISWLEKQKDANKAIEAVDRIDKYIDEHLANAHDMKDSNPDKKYYRGWDDALGKMSGILQDVYSGEKQKEQKKEELVYRLNGLMQDYIKEGKDDEEKEHRLKCYQLFWDALEDANFFGQKEQKPAEWSEEDERKYYQLEYSMKAAGSIPAHLIQWALKSLRPSWKPSEEQMEALKKTAEGCIDNGSCRIIATLLEQLKKL